MDQRLVAWARAVKARRGTRCGSLPVLWLFTDGARAADPLPAIRALPRGLCGVVFRHDGVSGREQLGRAIARICRDRRLCLVVAGDPRLAVALRAGVHLRAGAGAVPPLARMVTASAHGLAELRRARLRGADAVFLSPVFATLSHPGARPLGPVRFAALAGIHHCVLALGGIDGMAARGLPGSRCAGAGAIGALGVDRAPI